MHTFQFRSNCEEETDRLGELLAAALPDGVVVGLSGTLGAGKTRLVQAIAAACGMERSEILSPTFVLCQSYEGTRTIYHLDAYRIQDDDEFLELGVEELFEAPAITFVEWPERVADVLPTERLEVRIEVLGASQRQFEVVALGSRFENVVTSLAHSAE